MKRINYIFIDYENVHPTDLSRVKDKNAQVHLVLGARQEHPSRRLQEQIEEHAEKVELVRTPMATKNALDFVLAFELGDQAMRDPDGFFHIISRDKGFDVLVKHLRNRKILAARRESLGEIPALMSAEERFNYLVARLCGPEKGRPTSRKALESTIQSVFDHSLNSDVVEKAIALLIHEGVIEISESGRVEYPQSLR